MKVGRRLVLFIGMILLGLLSVGFLFFSIKMVYADTSTESQNNSETLVSFDVEGISPEFIAFGTETHQFPVPQNDGGKTFIGWFLNDIQYTDDKGNLLKSWDIDSSEVILTAGWSGERYIIKTVVDNKTYFYSVTNGWTANLSFCQYGETLRSGLDQLETDFRKDVKKENYTLDYFSLDGVVFKLSENKIPDLGKDGETFELFPNFTREIHTIYYDADGGSVIPKTGTVESGQPSKDVLAKVDVQKEGYELKGWLITECQGNSDLVGQKLDDYFPDCTINQGNGSIKLQALWNYKITYVYPKELEAEDGGEKVLDTLYTPQSQITEYTAADAVILPTIESDAYDLIGWYKDTDFKEEVLKIEKGTSGDLTLYAKFTLHKYTIIFNANGGSTCSNVKAKYGERIVLPSSTKEGYLGTWKAWNFLTNTKYDSNFGKYYEVTQDETFIAQWKQIYNIKYENIVFGDSPAKIIFVENSFSAPHYYFAGESFPLDEVMAWIEVMSPYQPQLRFLGWYVDFNFSKEINTVPANRRSDITVYAKWRYDYTCGSRLGTYTITDSGRFNQNFDQIFIGMSDINLYNSLVTLGMRYLLINFSISMWEINDGYQDFYIYADDEKEVTIYEIKNNEHGSKKGVDSWTIVIPITEVRSVSYLNFRYSCHGNFEDTWKTDKMYYEVMYLFDKIAPSIGTYKPNPPFIWDYENPFE